MTNIEKVKRILDAGHWVKATSEGFIITITSYNKNKFTYLHDGSIHISTYNFDNYTIEVIQRIPTAYKSWEKVLVLSNPWNDRYKQYVDMMVWKICEIKNQDGLSYAVFNEDKSAYWIFPSSCLAPYFDDEEKSDMNRIISGKEAKIVIDGKEYTCVIK